VFYEWKTDRRREEKGRKKKRKGGKIREGDQRVGENKFKGKIRYKCVFFKL